MRPNATVQRKCLWCGHIYDESDMLFGIVRCPSDRCWMPEKFIYIDAAGNPRPDYKPKGYEINGYIALTPGISIPGIHREFSV